MQRHIKKFTLWILCVDDITYEILTKLNLVNVKLLRLSKIETKELLKVKPSRSKGEYCWTLTPFAPRFVFDADVKVKRVTYIDADLYFLKSPKPIFDEFDISTKAVLITEHAYSADNDHSDSAGIYCVQFMIFKRNDSEIVRSWWEDKCIEWCYARVESGKFGDQKYLDDWAVRFEEYVHVLNNKELALAPWNALRFPYSSAVFWHFHGLRLLTNKKAIFGAYILPEIVIEKIYRPYLADLREIVDKLSTHTEFKAQDTNYGIPTFFKKLRRIIYSGWINTRSLFPYKF